MARELTGGRHIILDDGTLAGGDCRAIGASVVWASDPDEISGAGPQTLTLMLLERLKKLQTTQYRCEEFEHSLRLAEQIDAQLIRRQQDREYRKVVGTQKP